MKTTNQETKMINGDEALRRLEEYRERKKADDYTIRVCEAIIADMIGYKKRIDWRHLQTNS